MSSIPQRNTYTIYEYPVTPVYYATFWHAKVHATPGTQQESAEQMHPNQSHFISYQLNILNVGPTCNQITANQTTLKVYTMCTITELPHWLDGCFVVEAVHSVSMEEENVCLVEWGVVLQCFLLSSCVSMVSYSEQGKWYHPSASSIFEISCVVCQQPAEEVVSI